MITDGTIILNAIIYILDVISTRITVKKNFLKLSDYSSHT